MDDAKPSLTRRLVAALVLVVVAIIAVRLVIGVISAVFWMVALVALLIGAIWAVSTLKSGRRERRVKPSSTDRLPAAAPEDRVEAQMREIRQQLREQGRL